MSLRVTSRTNNQLIYRGSIPLLSLLILQVSLLSCSGSNWSEDKILASQERGDRIAAALNKYHADNGIFPKSLKDLTPKYINEITPPMAGNQEWRYAIIENGNDFILIFEDDSPHLPTATRKSQSVNWLVDSK